MKKYEMNEACSVKQCEMDKTRSVKQCEMDRTCSVKQCETDKTCSGKLARRVVFHTSMHTAPVQPFNKVEMNNCLV